MSEEVNFNNEKDVADFCAKRVPTMLKLRDPVLTAIAAELTKEQFLTCCKAMWDLCPLINKLEKKDE